VPSATIAAPKAEERAMSEVTQDTAPTGASTVHVTRAEGESPNSEARRRQLAETAREHGIEEVFARGMAEGQDTEALSRSMFDALKERMKKGPQFAARVSMSEREEREYSVAKAILLSDSGENGFEREISDEIAKRLPQGYKPAGGLFVPTNLGQSQQRTALEASTSSLGGAAVFTQYGGMIDLLRNNAFVIQAGATVLPGLDAPVSFVKQLTPGVAYWVDEASGSDVTESNLTLGLVSLTPKTLQATQAFSRQLLVQARRVMQAEQMVRNDLARIHALAIDAAAIAGTGTLQPLGITKSTNVGTVTIGAQGGVPTYDFLVDQEVQVRAGNVAGELAYLTTPGIAGKLKKTQRFATTNGEAVWTGDLINGRANGARAFATNQVPSNLTKGSQTTICHAIIAGAFQNMIIGEFGAVEIITDPYSKKKQGLLEVTSFQMVDLNWRYDAAFSVILDAKIA
jgi:HK97 family phage major capsid protein